jgi:3-dehydroquinate dehydratase/shikimate dehydrogenase
MTRTCLSLTGTTLEENLKILDKYRQWIDVAELRADFLIPSEMKQVPSFPSRAAGMPLILTVRRVSDGGCYTGDEQERCRLLRRSLSGAERFRYLDLEEDFEDRETMDAVKRQGIRVIRSFHDFEGVPGNLPERIAGLPRTREEIPKAAVYPRSTQDVTEVFRAQQQFRGKEAIVLGMGSRGFPTRILAPLFATFLTYTSERGKEAAPGHIDPSLLHETYRFSSLKPGTKVFGIIGNPVMHSYSPVIHNAGFDGAGYDGVYVPFEIDSIASFITLSSVLEVRGVSVTHPFKEEVIDILSRAGAGVQSIGACNTLLKTAAGWEGENFDWSGFLVPLDRLAGPLAGKKCTVLGAGGAARAVVYALIQAGAHVLILNRTPERAQELAGAYRCAWGRLEPGEVQRVGDYADLIVQTTSLGMHPHENDDPLEGYTFLGHELVYDLVYVPAKTKLLRRAEAAGCRTINGKEMLLQQAYKQFRFFTGIPYPEEKKYGY